MEKKFKILVLDGGGSKGVYTIGVLKELEMKLGGRLFEHFNLVYGTSTGSIIATLIALGYKVQEIEDLYLSLIPQIMGGLNKFQKSENLKSVAKEILGDKMFDEFKTDIGIVALNYDTQQPLIFKSSVSQAHGMKHSFQPGFGCTISDAVQCSCSAYPIFNMKTIDTANQGNINAVDGGFIANNATLFALIDAHKAFKVEESEIRLLNIGVGNFVEKPMGILYRFIRMINTVKFIERVLSANTNTNAVTSKLLFPNLHSLRISETFNEPEYGTNMLEKDDKKLRRMIQLGRGSFAKFEREINHLFSI